LIDEPKPIRKEQSKMAKSTRFFLSDIHLSSNALYKNGAAWFKKKKHQARLIKFLDENILDNPKVKEVVLLGDIFDTWICPADMEPPTFQDIFKANQPILDKFIELTKSGIDLLYVNGNHDFDLAETEIKAAIPGIKPIKIYNSGLLRAEHGNRFDEIFNAKDYFCDPAFGRPIGYIISRLVSSFTNSGYSLIDLPTYLDDIVEAAGPDQNIFETIIEGLAERADMDDNDVIKMPLGKTQSIKEAKSRYGKLEEKYGFSDFIRELWDRSALGWHADRMCHQDDVNVVIFGHSHKAMIDKDFFLVKDRIYANTGCWCKPNAYCVSVEKTKSLKVNLLKIDSKGDIIETTEKTI
jgi:UDP-2,3-diacylglucosamine pyrophosphatase LpxH